MATIFCPQIWDEEPAIDFVNSLDTFSTDDSLTIDFGPIQFVKPFGTLIVANGLRRLHKTRKQNNLALRAKVPRIDSEACSYLRHVGFFEYVGLSPGKRLGNVAGGRTYVPIQIVSLSQLRSLSTSRALHDGIETVSDRLAEVVYPRLSEQIMMQYCLREVIRNVFEHGDTDSCTVFAQRYQDGRAEIAIVDEGIGIFASLGKTIQIVDADGALKKSMMPGVSRVTRPSASDEWVNSGFGLYVLSELGKDLGDFLLASSGRYSKLSRQSTDAVYGDLKLEGTAVKLMVDLAHADYFPNRLRAIVERGEQQHLTDHGKVKSASKRSLSTKSLQGLNETQDRAPRQE